MRDLMAELKELRLHGMASAWEELASQGEASTASSEMVARTSASTKTSRSCRTLCESSDEHGQTAHAS